LIYKILLVKIVNGMAELGGLKVFKNGLLNVNTAISVIFWSGKKSDSIIPFETLL